MSKHTPGPWKAEYVPSLDQLIKKAEGETKDAC